MPVSTKIRQDSCQDSCLTNLDALAIFAIPVSTKTRQESCQDFCRIIFVNLDTATMPVSDMFLSKIHECFSLVFS